MTVKGKPRVGGFVTLEVTGSNELFPVPVDPDFPDRTPLDYALDVDVQNRALHSTCAANVDDQNDRIINLPAHVKHIAWGLNARPSGPFRHVVKFPCRHGARRR